MDLRIEHIFDINFKNDKSFTEKKILFPITYKQSEVKEIWKQGIKLGIETGLRCASIEGQILELNNNTINTKHKEFIDKFYRLSEEYKCAISYHPKVGLIITDLNTNKF